MQFFHFLAGQSLLWLCCCQHPILEHSIFIPFRAGVYICKREVYTNVNSCGQKNIWGQSGDPLSLRHLPDTPQRNPFGSTKPDPVLAQPASPSAITAGCIAGCIRCIQQHLSQILDCSVLQGKFEKTLQTSLDGDQFLYFASNFKSQHCKELLYIGLRPFDKCHFWGISTFCTGSWTILFND